MAQNIPVPVPKPPAEGVKPLKWRVLKGLILVLAVSSILFFANMFYISQLAALLPSLTGTGMEVFFTIPSLINMLLFSIVIGLVIWFLRALFSFLITKYGFKSIGQFRDLLYGYGVAYLLFLIMAIGRFTLFLGNFGIFLGVFLSTLSLLLVYMFFIRALQRFQNLNWKKGIAVVIVTDVIISLITYFLIHPLTISYLIALATPFAPSYGFFA